MPAIPQPATVPKRYNLTFPGKNPDTQLAVFHVTEETSSRGIEPNSSVVYDAFLVPPSDTQWSTDIELFDVQKWQGSTVSEELIIAANVYRHAGCTLMGGHIVKKWPPTCVRNRPNAFRVVISYAPLYVANFQISPQKTKKKVAIDTVAWKNNGATFGFVDVRTLPPDQQIAYHNINVDRKGIVQGVDTFDPLFMWTERWTYGPTKTLYPEAAANDAMKNYSDLLTSLSGCVNEFEFRGFPPQSVKFHYGVGRNILPFTWEVDYDFSYIPHKYYIQVGNDPWAIRIPAYDTFTSGHNLVDEEEQEYREGATQGDIITVPKNIRLHKTCPTGDFNLLSVAPEVPFGYGTPLDGTYSLKSAIVAEGAIPFIGSQWALPEWAEYSLP